jgi:hypothetical protein
MMTRPSTTTDATSHGPAAWAPGALLGVVSLFAAATLGLGPADDHQAAGIFPVWWSQARAVTAASRAGQIIGVGAAPFVVIARSDAPDVAAALRAQGAWLVVDPGLAAACAS